MATGLILVSTSDHKNSSLMTGQDFAGITMSTFGVAAVLTSVPFYISAYSNKRKSVKIQPEISINNVRTGENLTSQASLGVSFSF